LTVAVVPADVADFEQVKAIADKAIQQYGRLDTWVHLAAINLYAIFEQTDNTREFKRVIDVNLMGQVHGAMAALPHLKREGRGSLLHVSERGSLDVRSHTTAPTGHPSMGLMAFWKPCGLS
jgi:NAD(P)-dependent dehydrogenase (short-subunit alcohol dehydrogenase family)